MCGGMRERERERAGNYDKSCTKAIISAYYRLSVNNKLLPDLCGFSPTSSTVCLLVSLPHICVEDVQAVQPYCRPGA